MHIDTPLLLTLSLTILLYDSFLWALLRASARTMSIPGIWRNTMAMSREAVSSILSHGPGASCQDFVSCLSSCVGKDGGLVVTIYPDAFPSMFPIQEGARGHETVYALQLRYGVGLSHRLTNPEAIGFSCCVRPKSLWACVGIYVHRGN